MTGMTLTEKRAWRDNQIFYFVMGTLYSFALSHASIAATILQIPPLRLFVIVACFMTLFFIAFSSKKSAFASVGLAIVLLLAVIVYLRGRFGEEWFDAVKRFCQEISLFVYRKIPPKDHYNITLTTAIAFLYSLVVAMNIRIEFNFPILALLGIATIFIPLTMRWGKSPLAYVLLIFCMFVFLVRQLNLQTTRGERRDLLLNSRFALTLIPIIAGVLCVSWMIPRPDQLLEKGFSLSDRFRDAADNLVYDVGPDQNVAFTEPGERLGGPIEMNDGFVMEVYAEERMYLSASVRDTYTGQSWDIRNPSSHTLAGNGGDYETYETSEYTDHLQERQSYYSRFYDMPTRSVEITMNANRSKHIFTPPFRNQLTLPEGYEVEMDMVGAVSINKPLERYARYTQTYISWRYTNEYFENYVLKGENGAAREGNLDNYLELPADLPQRVRDLATDLTAGHYNDYDKLKAIEQYLQQFPYTLEPDPIPRDRDFVDYFLFEGQEGYCVYFASAMAVLARCVDIPVRYVEGFVMPQEKGPEGSYTVMDKHGHAWVEAYFADFGWAPFEATPPSFLEINEQMASETEPEPAEEESEAPEESQPEEPENESLPDPMPGDEEDPAGENPEKGRAGPVWGIVLAILVVAGLVAATVRLLVAVYDARLKQLQKLPNKEAAEGYFSRILQAAAALGYPMGAQETAHTYAERVGGEPVFQEGTAPLEEAVGVFAKASYSLADISDQERSLLETCYDELVEKLREEKRNPLRFFLHRYVFMQF